MVTEQKATTWMVNEKKAANKLSEHTDSRLKPSNKTRNKRMKMKNGNGKKTITIAHWNIGSKQWQRKVDTIQDLVD